MIVHDPLTRKIIQAQATDDHIQAIKQIVITRPYVDYVLKNDVLHKLYYGVDLLVVCDDMQMNVIKHIHECNHFARKHCEVAVKEQFFIKFVR